MSIVWTYDTSLVESLREGDWKPLNPGYDFLKMMDAEEKKDDLDFASDTSESAAKSKYFFWNKYCLNWTLPFGS